MQTHQATPEQASAFFQAKLAFTSGPVEVASMLKNEKPVRIIDVRDKKAFDAGHVPGAVNLPKDQWQHLDQLSKDDLNVIYCYSQVCHLAAKAAAEFASQGFRVMEMEGGFASWKDHKLPVETAEALEASHNHVAKDDNFRPMH
jgi:rhodanese-related sulfurtransferase